MNSKLYLSSTTALLCTGLQVLLLHWGPGHCFIWSSLRTVGASCSDSLDWAFTDTLLAVELGHYWCFRSTLQNQTDFKHQTEFKLLYLLPMHIINPVKNCEGRKSQERALATVREQFGNVPCSPFESKSRTYIGSSRSSKIFSGFEKAEPIDK